HPGGTPLACRRHDPLRDYRLEIREPSQMERHSACRRLRTVYPSVLHASAHPGRSRTVHHDCLPVARMEHGEAQRGFTVISTTQRSGSGIYPTLSYSHSIVARGFEVMSYAAQLTPALHLRCDERRIIGDVQLRAG